MALDKKDKFYLFLVSFLIIIILFLNKCGGGKSTPHNTLHDTIKLFDTTYITTTINVPTYVPKYRDKIVINTIHDSIKYLVNVDTNEILKDYFATYVYNDSSVTDTLKLYINDSITQNKIKNRSISYTLTNKNITQTNNIIVNKNEFYLGANLVGSQYGIYNFGPAVALRTKNKRVYSLGVGVGTNLKPSLSVSMYWKLGKK